MIGAQALVGTLTGCGVDVCFTNPGTSEMHVVAALDAVPEGGCAGCCACSREPRPGPRTATAG